MKLRIKTEKHCEEIWAKLFMQNRHLDAALSEADREMKGLLARTFSLYLRMPSTLSKVIGVPFQGFHTRDLPEGLLALLRILESGSRLELPQRGGLEDFPEPLVAAWHSDWGERVARLLASRLTEAPVQTLRVSAAFPRERAQAGLPSGFRPTVYSPWGLNSREHQKIHKSVSYEGGKVEIQDEGSQVIAGFALESSFFTQILALEPSVELSCGGEVPAFSPKIVIDVCAGAGGKTLACGDLMGNRGRVYAYDVSLSKLQALRRRARRVGLTNLQVHQVPEEPDREWIQKFAATADVVLVDAPCSGWGVLRRSPDQKWRGETVYLREFSPLQKKLLEAYAPLVKPGGSLVYSVCTFRRSESLDVTDGLELIGFTRGERGYFGPHSSGADGFFMGRWRRDL